MQASFCAMAGAVRPPWAVRERAFAALCDGCGRCAASCPEKLITMGPNGLPEMDFTEGGCSFCGECAESCPSGALAEHGQGAWHNKAQITSQCFSWQGVLCRLCAARCGAGAIRFRPALGGYVLPEIDTAACDGCGACVGVCPAKAVEIAAAPS